MAEIIKVYRESLPKVKLVGRRYTDADRDQFGGFGQKWGEWFATGLFEPLDQLTQLTDEQNGYVGCMRFQGEMEYWIGALTTHEGPLPEGYDHVDIPAGDIAVCWIHGREDTGEIYSPQVYHECVERVKEQGWQLAEGAWSFERYHCPRFTAPDQEGKVILDLCFYLAE